MTKNNWKVGDKCYLEFRPGEIRKVEKDGRVTDVSDGCGCLGGHDLRDVILDISPKVEATSNEFSKYYDQISNMNCGLNCPDIFQWFVKKWVSACDANPSEYSMIIGEIKEFITLLEQVLSTKYKGMAVFR